MLKVLKTVHSRNAVVAILFAALVLQVCLLAGTFNIIVVHGAVLATAWCMGLTVAFLTLQHSQFFNEHRIQIATFVLLAAVLTLTDFILSTNFDSHTWDVQSSFLRSMRRTDSNLGVGVFFVILLWDVWHLVCTRTLSYLAGSVLAFCMVVAIGTLGLKISGIDPRW